MVTKVASVTQAPDFSLAFTWRDAHDFRRSSSIISPGESPWCCREKKRTRIARRNIGAVIERLDPRLIVDAPLALASSGLVLAGPADMEKQEPALFAAVPAPEGLTPPPTPLPPLDPKDDPLSPIGDPKRGGGGVEMSSSCCGSCLGDSALCDAGRFTGGLEAAYQATWRRR